MALKLWAGNRWTGLVADGKPANQPDGTLFHEEDGDRDRYISVGGTWHKYATGGGGGGINYTVDVFTSSGTYNKPADLDYCYVLVVGGGGGANSGRRGAASSNRGGGGAYNGISVLYRYDNSDLDSSEAVTVGAGGTGAAAQSTDNTNGLSGNSGGNSSFVGGNAVGGRFTGGGTFLLTQTNQGEFLTITSRKNLLHLVGQSIVLGVTLVSDSVRGNSLLQTGFVLGPFNATSTGGGIRNTNVQENAGTLAGFYDDANTLIDEITGTAPEAGDGAQPTQFYTFGQFFARLFPWFDPADANYNIGRGGVGGGCGDLAGTIAGGKGGDALGYGAGGGGGGASTNGANSGAGGNGSDGIVIIINVLTS